MLNVALTGNIAAGKSTVAELFRHWGATIIDADELAREVQAPGSPVLAAIAKRFGAGVLQPDGSLNRTALRTKVMGNEAALAKLNALVHPAVQRRREALLDEAWKRGDRIVVNDIPLLFEALDPKQFDVVVLVDAPVPLRHARLRGMRGLSAHEADQMLAAQMPAPKKRKGSDFVIDNEGNLEELTRRARVVYDELERRASAKPQA
jgi:dephospho-CoA kinase